MMAYDPTTDIATGIPLPPGGGNYGACEAAAKAKAGPNVFTATVSAHPFVVRKTHTGALQPVPQARKHPLCLSF